MKISLFPSAKDVTPSSSLVFDQYLEYIKEGKWQDIVLPIQVLSEKYKNGEVTKEVYQAAKAKVEAVTASGVFSKRSAANIIDHSGFIAIDFDTDDNPDGIPFDTLAADTYTYAMHRSIGGGGCVVYVKINPKRHLDAFLGLEKHYANEHKAVIDKSCKDVSRLRYISFDPDLIRNVKARIFKAYLPKKEVKARTNNTPFVCGGNDVEMVLNQLNKLGANIAENYDDWLRLAFAFSSEFGESGRQYFHEVSKASAKYDAQATDKKYTHALGKTSGKTNIGTFFYLAKMAGVTTIKTQETAMVETIAKKNHSLVGKTGYFKDADQAKETTIKEVEQKGIKLDIEDVAKIATTVSKMDIKQVKETQLTGDPFEDSILFVKSLGLRFNEVTRCIEREGKDINDMDYNSFYLQAKRLIGKGVTKSDIINIIESDSIEPYHPFMEFFEQHYQGERVGHLQTLLSCLEFDNETSEYTELIRAFVIKWLISVVASMHGTYSIMCLVLCGAQQKGKTEFFRGLLPKELKKFYAESKLDEGKDDHILMTKKLLILDDEFGGKSKQDAKKFKDLISKQTFTLRRPYGRVTEDLPRFAVLCGTSNEEEILNDPTGNRRIIPVNIKGLNLERYKKIDKVGLWMELYDLYQDVGDTWMLDAGDIADLKQVAAKNQQASQEEEAFLMFFSIPEEGEYCIFKTNTEIKNTIELNTRLKISHIKLAAVLKSLGVKKQVKKINGVAQTVYSVLDLQP